VWGGSYSRDKLSAEEIGPIVNAARRLRTTGRDPVQERAAALNQLRERHARLLCDAERVLEIISIFETQAN
jgi:hypothetical protein